MYSIFENTLPAPLGWAQDYADLMFGNDEDKRRAFFGTYTEISPVLAPLQMFTPPSLRAIGPAFTAILTDDWSKFGHYTAHTLYPFGRIGRDIYGNTGIINVGPSRLIEKMTGIPYQGFQTEYREIKENKRKQYYPHILGWGYGN